MRDSQVETDFTGRDFIWGKVNALSPGVKGVLCVGLSFSEVMSLTLSVMSAMLGVPGAFTGVMLIESMMGLQSRHIHG